jgi:hypothetical protein
LGQKPETFKTTFKKGWAKNQKPLKQPLKKVGPKTTNTLFLNFLSFLVQPFLKVVLVQPFLKVVLVQPFSKRLF